MAALFFIFGLVVGSFLNVCIYRIPRKLSIVFPPSFCPNCKRRIKPYDNIPVLSYILLRGRCRHCKKGISLIYPLVELLTGIIFYFLYLKLSLSLNLLLSLLYFSLLIVCAFLDWKEKSIYDPLVYAGVILGILLHLPKPLFSIFGIVIGAVSLLLLRLFGFLWKRKEMLGMGDVFLGGMMGSLLGWRDTLIAIFLGAFLGLITSILLITTRVWKRGEEIPFGSFLCLAAGMSFFFGEEILNLYLGLFSFPR